MCKCNEELCRESSVPSFGALPQHTHTHTGRNIKAPRGTRASQSPFSPRQEQALPYDEEQLLFLASSQVAADCAPLSPLMAQVPFVSPSLPSLPPRSQLLIISSHCRVCQSRSSGWRHRHAESRRHLLLTHAGNRCDGPWLVVRCTVVAQIAFHLCSVFCVFRLSNLKHESQSTVYF